MLHISSHFDSGAIEVEALDYPPLTAELAVQRGRITRASIATSKP